MRRYFRVFHGRLLSGRRRLQRFDDNPQRRRDDRMQLYRDSILSNRFKRFGHLYFAPVNLNTVLRGQVGGYLFICDGAEQTTGRTGFDL
jgi:hypothetical protein